MITDQTCRCDRCTDLLRLRADLRTDTLPEQDDSLVAVEVNRFGGKQAACRSCTWRSEVHPTEAHARLAFLEHWMGR